MQKNKKLPKIDLAAANKKDFSYYYPLAEMIPLTREQLAERIGITHPNLVAALKGRRGIPKKSIPAFLVELGLNNDFRLKNDVLHVWRSEYSDAKVASFEAAVTNYLAPPITVFPELQRQNHWASDSGFDGDFDTSRGEIPLSVIQDFRGVLVVITIATGRPTSSVLSTYERHLITPNTIPAWAEWSGFDTSRGGRAGIENEEDVLDPFISREERPETIYISDDAYNRISSGEMTPKEFYSIIKEYDNYWTWYSFRKRADLLGLSPGDLAKKLGWPEVE